MNTKRFGSSPEGNPPEPGPEEIAQILEKCKKDIIYWINNHAMTFDPRRESPFIPFKLYPYQEKLVKRLVNHIRNGEDIVIEKSRDMGISWLVLLVFQWFWLFQPGCTFLLGSRKQAMVDRHGDMSTLMEKLRYSLANLPEWMKPQGFNQRLHAPLMKLYNPENGNTITGESSTGNFGRSGRYTAIFMDEFAYWRNDDMAFAAASFASPCRIIVSTPHGSNNKFFQVRYESGIHVETIHWRLHPDKTDEWYDEQKKRMTEDEIARELDINYNMSARDRVFKEFTPDHICPLVWNDTLPVFRIWDFGYHINAVLFVQQDHEGRLNVLHEEVGELRHIEEFGRHVLAVGERHFPGARFRDYADPSGNKHNETTTLTSIEYLNQMGIYPTTMQIAREDSLLLLRGALIRRQNQVPLLLVHERCKFLIRALQGGYRYRRDSDQILEEHPHEDVADCLRYAAWHLLKPGGGRHQKMPGGKYINPGNPYTGY